MSHSINKIIIKRCSFRGKCGKFIMWLCTEEDKKKSFLLHGGSFQIYSRIKFRHPTEERAAFQIVNMFVRGTGLVRMRSEILEGFEELHDDDLMGDCELTMKIPVPPLMTCGKCENVPTGENAIDQCEIARELKEYDKDSKVAKFFDENSCPVCLSTYKEILDEDLHIVAPSCGHPLCCKCAGNIVRSRCKQCPCCKRNVAPDSYKLLKFNADLKIDQQDQRVFL